MVNTNDDKQPGAVERLATSAATIVLARIMQIIGVPIAGVLLFSVWNTVNSTHDATINLQARVTSLEIAVYGKRNGN